MGCKRLIDSRFSGQILASALLCSVVLWAFSAAGRMIDRIVAVVNNEAILLSEVDKMCKYTLEQVPAALPPKEAIERKRKIRLDVLHSLVDDKLMEQEIRERGIKVVDEEVEKFREQVRNDNELSKEKFEEALLHEGKTLKEYDEMLRQSMKKRKLMQRELLGKGVVGEKDIQEFYKEHYLGGPDAEKVLASHILFSIPPGTSADQEQAVHAKAAKVLAELKAGADFAKMAREKSDDPSAATDGDLGWFRRGDMVAAFEKAAFSQDKGEMSSLVRTRFGYHIILVTDRVIDKPPPLDTESGEIRIRLMKELERRLTRNWLDDLRRQSYIEIRL